MQERMADFLEGLVAAGDDRHEIIMRVREELFAAHPALEEKFQYGGILFYLEGQARCGLFARKDFVALELGNAAHLSDPFGHLEGKGTKEGRRHLRLVTISDITDRHVSEYLDLIWDLSPSS